MITRKNFGVAEGITLKFHFIIFVMRRFQCLKLSANPNEPKFTSRALRVINESKIPVLIVK